MQKSFKVFLIGAVALIPICGFLGVQHNRLLQALYILLLGGWYLGFVIWIGAVDAKKRWPHLRRFKDRMGAVLTFDARRHDEYARQMREANRD